MEDYEFAWKTDSEGGLFNALFGYGLKSSDLAPDSELKPLIEAVEEAYKVFGPIYEAAKSAVMTAAEEFEEQWDED